ncbi:tellurite resistance TerB family protein [Vibrio phage BUCT194]|uniref:Tellurite resistance TerB family protein n=1 Tax=Vibrio phage BUCT194 TaxID=2859072 RepID=A0AAE8XHG8_9CAUD|nr:tellurite resistance [Vibrio phage BUCT194]UAW01126.1 tellurite resistance TerB family protein [Vibrio phage BUCT194]
MFGKLFNRGKVAAKKLENRDQVEATIAGGVLLGWADGDFSADEVKALESALTNNENLSHFSTEIPAMVEKFNAFMESGPTLGRVKVLKEIRDLKGDEEASIEVMATLIDIAQADGDVADVERKVLETIARELGLSLSMFGL